MTWRNKMDSFNIQNYFQRGKTVVLTLRHGDDDGARNWSDKETTDLMSLMNAFLPEFQNPRRRKKEVWEDVAKRLATASGSAWTAEDCRKKWSNMIRTFKGIEEQKQDSTSTTKRHKWPFFDPMHALMSLAGADAFPEALSAVQLLNSGATSVTQALSNQILERKAAAAAAALKSSSPSVTKSHLHRQAPPHLAVSAASATSPSQPVSFSHTSGVVSISHNTQNSILPGIQGLEENVFSESSQTHQQANVSSQQESPAFSSTNTSKPTLAIRAKKRPLSKKSASAIHKKKGEETLDSTLAKFIDTTTQQNQQMLEKLTSFHESAISLMIERNDLLRDIRDSLTLCSDVDNVHHHHHDESLVQALDSSNDPHGANALTLHMGPAFTTASGTNGTVGGESVTSHHQLNSTLVISDAATASALSSFQLEEGSVVTSIDETHDGAGCLANLGSFTQSVIPDVSLLQCPTIVSVVTDPSGGAQGDMQLVQQNE